MNYTLYFVIIPIAAFVFGILAKHEGYDPDDGNTIVACTLASLLWPLIIILIIIVKLVKWGMKCVK